MDDAVPKKAGESVPSDDASQAIDCAFEEHEIELFAALDERITGRLRPGGSDEDRRAAAVEIFEKDPEACELYMRLKLIQHFGGGNFTRRVVELRDT